MRLNVNFCSNCHNISDVDIISEVLEENGFNVNKILKIITSQECKDKLISNTNEAVNRGAFGVPTFMFDNQIFFGKDHLYQLEEYIYSK